MNFLPIFAAIISIAFSVGLIFAVRRRSAGDERMREIQNAIREGSKSYLARQNKTVALVAVAAALILFFAFGAKMALGFLLGAFASALAGYLGMMTAVDSNARVAEAAKSGLGRAFRTAFMGGSVTGFLVVGLALLATSGFYLLFHDLRALTGLAFGGSLISVFARLGGGIYTKAADVGTDLVGKVEAGIPEDDPRNAGVIADLVGDEVGDCAGMAADLFETYAVTMTGAMLLGAFVFRGAENVIAFPLLIGAASIFASIVGSLFVKIDERKPPEKVYIMGGLYKGFVASIVVSAALIFWLTWQTFGADYAGKFWSGIVGLAITGLIVLITEYYTSKKFRPVRNIVEASASGHATNIIMGLAMSLESSVLPVLTISAGVLTSYFLAGVYGVALAVTSMLSLAGIVIAIDSFGPITDNAGGIAEIAGLPKEARKTTDALDAVGNTTKAVTKGFAIGSAHLAALTLFVAYSASLEEAGRRAVFELANPYVIVGLFLGALLPNLFASISLRAVSRAAQSIVNEVRRQFREIKGIMTGEAKPDYGRAVDIVTKAALKEMIVPAMLPVLGPLAVFFVLRSHAAEALGGFMIGAILAGVFIAFSMTSGGAAWDNAKKFIEEGNLGGKGSEAHRAAVTGDTVGDPYKDTAGPAINPMIKVVNIVALLLIPFL